MTEQTTDTERPGRYDFSTDPDGVTREEILDKDYYLELLFDMLFGLEDDETGSAGMTFHMGGTVISGTAIAHNVWRELFLEQLAKGGELGEAMREISDEAIQRADETNARRRSEGRPIVGRQMVHMKDAVIYSGNKELRVGLWRGTIDSIDGWTMGTMARAQSN